MWGVTVDFDDSSTYLLWLVQSGLGLPDRDSYDGTSDAAVELRAAYVRHVAAQLVNVGTEPEEALELADGVLDLETRWSPHRPFGSVTPSTAIPSMWSSESRSSSVRPGAVRMAMTMAPRPAPKAAP